MAGFNAGAASVGVCYGTSGDNLPPASTVVGMLRENGFTVVRLYWPDPAALAALAGTGIKVVVGAPNDVLPRWPPASPRRRPGSGRTSRPTRW